MIRKVKFEEIHELVGNDPDIVARLNVDPILDVALIQKIKTIKGVGWVSDKVDYAAISNVSSKEILLSGGCPGVWCEHMQQIVSTIVEILKQAGEVNYEGPSLSSAPY